MSKVRNIINLYTSGVSMQSIGERTGLPRNNVKKHIRLFLTCIDIIFEYDKKLLKRR